MTICRQLSNIVITYRLEDTSSSVSTRNLRNTSLDRSVQVGDRLLPLLLGHLGLARLLPHRQDLLQERVRGQERRAMRLRSVQSRTLSLAHLAALLRLALLALLLLLNVHLVVLVVGELVVTHRDIALVAAALRHGLLALLGGRVVGILLLLCGSLALALGGGALVVELAGGLASGLVLLPAVGELGRLGRGCARGRVGSALLTVHFCRHCVGVSGRVKCVSQAWTPSPPLDDFNKSTRTRGGIQKSERSVGACPLRLTCH